MGNKKKFKIISIITILFVISTLISLKGLIVSADPNGEELSDKPSFKIIDLKATPNPAKVGEDILISGKIEPIDFETSTQPKEIVLVLDTSGSMSQNINTTCTNVRERYCTTHKSSVDNHTGSNHNWIENYCVEHGTNTNHNTTRINELKKAAKLFIETMDDVLNLKIGIVKYASDATIVSQLKSVNDPSLLTSINGLSANGGTNVREGLRKATYLLDKEKNNANKTIVLMTDGNPTYYSTRNSLDDTNPTRYGNGSTTTTETMTYTNSFAKNQISTRKYNAYSIGYGLDTNGNKYLKQIHASMKNLAENVDLNEELGFFSKSDGSITEIFKQIAENIKNSYELKEVSLEISLNQTFKLAIGGNEIEIGTINYNKVSEDKVTGKIRYHAEPIDFSFIVKATQIGQMQQIFDNIDISFLFENEKLNATSKCDVKIDIISNELPNIETKLISGREVKVNEDEVINLKYEIQPYDFVFNDETNAVQSDVVFVVDVSNDMSNYMSPLISDIWNDILNDDKLKSRKTEYDLITFSNKIEPFNLSLEDYSTYNQYIATFNNNYIKKYLKSDNSNSKNISNTYDKIIDLLENAREGTRKNVVFISTTSNIINGQEVQHSILSSKGYNIITVEIENLNNSNNKNDLKNLHTKLGGVPENYLYAKDKNELQNTILSEVANKIISNSTYKDYIFTPKLQIDLGGNFDFVSGYEKVENNIATINIPQVTYKYYKADNNYKAEKFTVEFVIKPKSGKIGNLSFGRDNKLIYKKLINDELKYSLVDTPIITVIQQIKDLTHGLYNGIENNDIYIQESDELGFNIPQGSTVTFGSKFTLGGSNANFKLNIDSKFNSVNTEDINIYKVTKDSSGNTILTGLLNDNKTIKNIETNNFDISIKGLNITESLYSEILIVYKAKIKDNSVDETFINEIKFDKVYKEVKIVTPKESKENPSLPDLF